MHIQSALLATPGTGRPIRRCTLCLAVPTRDPESAQPLSLIFNVGWGTSFSMRARSESRTSAFWAVQCAVLPGCLPTTRRDLLLWECANTFIFTPVPAVSATAAAVGSCSVCQALRTTEPPSSAPGQPGQLSAGLSLVARGIQDSDPVEPLRATVSFNNLAAAQLQGFSSKANTQSNDRPASVAQQQPVSHDLGSGAAAVHGGLGVEKSAFYQSPARAQRRGLSYNSSATSDDDSDDDFWSHQHLHRSTANPSAAEESSGTASVVTLDQGAQAGARSPLVVSLRRMRSALNIRSPCCLLDASDIMVTVWSDTLTMGSCDQLPSWRETT